MAQSTESLFFFVDAAKLSELLSSASRLIFIFYSLPKEERESDGQRRRVDRKRLLRESKGRAEIVVGVKEGRLSETTLVEGEV